MKESDAKTKWCPFAMVPTRITWEGGVGVASGNRGTAMKLPIDSARCVGSDCMAWRWKGGEASAFTLVEIDEGVAVGYCGLAGKPL